MALIERLMGIEPKIHVHQFQAILGEWARGAITGAQAQTACAYNSKGGPVLDAAAIAEVQAIYNTVPQGTTSALKADRALRLVEIDHILLLADNLTPPYNTPAAVRTRLGI